MRLFGKKQANKKQDKQKRKNKKPARVKHSVPPDVKLFLRLPIILAIGILMIVGGTAKSMQNISAHRELLMEQSMQKGEPLSLYAGTNKGTLTLGNSILSKDGKTMAVEIKYDDTAHKNLSSFGERYRLRLVDTYENPMDVKMTYGLFGTDGSGVLTVYSETGFRDKAFMVMIIDNGQLVTGSDLQNSTALTDSELDKSITAQLSNATNSDEESNRLKEEKKKLPPLYSLRLNAKNMQRDTKDWKTDKDIVEDLFVKSNLKAIKEKKDALLQKVAKGNKTLEEMNQRVKENPQDTVAQSNIQEIESSISQLQEQVTIAENNIKMIQTSVIKENVLAPKQEKSEKYTVEDLNYVK